jgi:hypothetical protein
MINVSDNGLKNQNKYLVFYNPFPEIRAIREIMLKNMVQPDRTQMITYCGAVEIRVARRITKTRIQTHIQNT